MRVRELLIAGRRVDAETMTRQPCEGWHDFLLAAGLCHDVKNLGAAERRLLGDPMELALVEWARKPVPESPACRRVDEISFDSDRMRQSVIYDMADGLRLFCKGAPEPVLALCHRVNVSGKIAALDDAARTRIVREQEAMAERGLRVLAFASKQLTAEVPRGGLEQALVFEGLAGLEDPPRADVADAVRRCAQAGIKVIMVTGDHPRTAVAIARQIGLVTSAQPEVITGDQIRQLSGAGLQLALDAPEIVFARVGADQKMREMREVVRAEVRGVRRPRGGSGITQQLVKNLFLRPGRSYVRKALEFPLALWVDLVIPQR